MRKKNNINLRYNIKNGKRKIQNKTNTNKESNFAFFSRLYIFSLCLIN